MSVLVLINAAGLKPGVRLGGIKPEMVIAHNIIAALYLQRNIPCIVTAGLDGTHPASSARHAHSLHYDGLALDFRAPSHDPAWSAQDDDEIVQAMRDALGPEFDVVLEHAPLHIHVEFDPKTPPVVASMDSGQATGPA